MAPDKGQKAKAGKTKRFVIVLIAVVVLGVGAYTGMHYTSQPQFCVSCHEIAPRVTSWQNGPHKNVECLSCHAAPGNIGYLARKVGAYKEVYLQVTHQIPNKLSWTPHPDSCLYCHSGKDPAYPKAKNITLKPGSGPNAPPISHFPIIEAKINCIECHGNVGHKAKAKP